MNSFFKIVLVLWITSLWGATGLVDPRQYMNGTPQNYELDTGRVKIFTVSLQVYNLGLGPKSDSRQHFQKAARHHLDYCYV